MPESSPESSGRATQILGATPYIALSEIYEMEQALREGRER